MVIDMSYLHNFNTRLFFKHGHNNKANLYSLVLQNFNHNNIPLEYFLIHVCLNSNYIQCKSSLPKPIKGKQKTL